MQPVSRTNGAKVVKSICPYCAVGCGQNVYVKDQIIVQIEGDSDSPISRGRLCPKGAATLSLVQNPLREYKVKYRRPYGTHWEALPLERAMEMIADRVLKTRRGNVGSRRWRRPPAQPLQRHRSSRRRDARQRRELPDEKTLHGAGRRAG